MAEILVLYYSRNGSVARLARQVARSRQPLARLHVTSRDSGPYLAHDLNVDGLCLRRVYANQHLALSILF